MSIKLVLPDGQEIAAEQMKFTIRGENFSEYKLSDGNILKIRVVLAEVYRTEEKDELTGRPKYLVKSSNVVSIEIDNKSDEKT